MRAKLWKHFAVGQIYLFNFFCSFSFISERRLILKDTIQKKKKLEEKRKTYPTNKTRTIEPDTIIYILLRIMEAKYVYRVAFGKTCGRILVFFFFYSEGSFTDDSQFEFLFVPGDASVSLGELERRCPAGRSEQWWEFPCRL